MVSNPRLIKQKKRNWKIQVDLTAPGELDVIDDDELVGVFGIRKDPRSGTLTVFAFGDHHVTTPASQARSASESALEPGDIVITVDTYTQAQVMEAASLGAAAVSKLSVSCCFKHGKWFCPCF